MKKIFLLIIIPFLLVGCREKSQEKTIISMAFQSAEETVQYDTALFFKKTLEQKSNGTIEVKIYPSGQLGNDRELIESTNFGDVSIVLCANSPLVPFMKEFGVFDAPMIFANKDPKNILKIFRDSEFRNKLNEVSRNSGFELLSLNCNNMYREMSSNIAVNSFDDFKKIRIRTMDNKYHMEFWKNLGASPTPIAFSELYLSLQQGLIDAQENPYEVLLYTGIYEQQKYIINTNHCLFVTTALMNKKQYDSLTKEQKMALIESIKEYEDYTNIVTNKSLGDQINVLENEKGLKIINPSEELINKMKEKAEPIYEMINKDIGDVWIKMLKKELENV